MDANDESVTRLDVETVDGWTIGDAQAILRTHNCRATGPRVAVLTALLRHGGPIDAGELTTLAQAEAAGIHEATVSNYFWQYQART